ncbi:MAG: transcriptional repressor LexA [Acidobacteriota bacterium]
MALTKRQREVLDFITDFIQSRRYSPSLDEIKDHFGLSSVATVHKHVSNLEEKGFIRRDWNRSRSIDLAPLRAAGATMGALDGVPGVAVPAGAEAPVDLPGVVELPGAVEAFQEHVESDEHDGSDDLVALRLQGRVAAGLPIEALDDESMAVPRPLVGPGRCFVLEVRGDSMIEEQIRDGDYVVVEERSVANPGEKVVAVIDGEATLKKYYPESDGSVRLEPANAAMEPIIVRRGEFSLRGVVIGLMRKYRR